MKNIDAERILRLTEEIEVRKGEIASKTLVQNQALNITLFAFDADEEISTHASHGDAFVQVLEGTGKFTIDSKDYELSGGDSIVMPAGKPHAIKSLTPFKWLLTVVY